MQLLEKPFAKTMPDAEQCRVAFNLSRWPIAFAQMPNPLQDAAWREYLDEVERLMLRREPFVLINDHKLGASPSASQRAEAALRLHRIQESAGLYLKASVMIANSAWERGAITALTWLRRSPVPLIAVASRDEAWREAEKVLSS